MSDELKKDGESQPDTSTRAPPKNLQLEQDDLVIFAEDGRFYLIQKSQYTATEVPPALLGAPEFVVGLGSMVSDLTVFLEWDESSVLLEKSACIVLNLAAIRQLSEKKSHEPQTFLEYKGGRRHWGRREELPPLQAKEKKSISPSADSKLGPDDLVLFHEDKKFYWVKKEEYHSDSHELPDVMRSTPELMVKLGTVIADIPSLPTAGCACFLLNLASVRKSSQEAAQLLDMRKLAETIQKRGPPSSEAEFRAAFKADLETASVSAIEAMGRDAARIPTGNKAEAAAKDAFEIAREVKDFKEKGEGAPGRLQEKDGIERLQRWREVAQNIEAIEKEKRRAAFLKGKKPDSAD